VSKIIPITRYVQFSVFPKTRQSVLMFLPEPLVCLSNNASCAVLVRSGHSKESKESNHEKYRRRDVDSKCEERAACVEREREREV
jgi:hypothetical protein